MRNQSLKQMTKRRKTLRRNQTTFQTTFQMIKQMRKLQERNKPKKKADAGFLRDARKGNEPLVDMEVENLIPGEAEAEELEKNVAMDYETPYPTISPTVSEALREVDGIDDEVMMLSSKSGKSWRGKEEKPKGVKRVMNTRSRRPVIESGNERVYHDGGGERMGAFRPPAKKIAKQSEGGGTIGGEIVTIPHCKVYTKCGAGKKI